MVVKPESSFCYAKRKAWCNCKTFADCTAVTENYQWRKKMLKCRELARNAIWHTPFQIRTFFTYKHITRRTAFYDKSYYEQKVVLADYAWQKVIFWRSVLHLRLLVKYSKFVTKKIRGMTISSQSVLVESILLGKHRLKQHRHLSQDLVFS